MDSNSHQIYFCRKLLFVATYYIRIRYCKRLAHPFHADKDDNIPFHLLEKIQI